MAGLRTLSRDALAAIDHRMTAAEIEAVVARARQGVGSHACGVPGPAHEPDIWDGWADHVARLTGARE